MGADSIPTRATGQTILDDFFNVMKRVCGVDWLPRNISGVVAPNAGQLGTPTYPWERANITSGYFVCGDVKMFHDFNGALTPGHGWMKCNGDVVNEASYDAIHGAGAWDEFIAASPIEGKYLPNMNNRFPVGATQTTQAGGGAITSEGNANHQTNISHTHAGPSHNHRWYSQAQGAMDIATMYDNTGGAQPPTPVGGVAGTIGIASKVGSGSSPGVLEGTYHTNNAGTGNTGAGGSTTQNIKPESIAFEFWMRII